MAPQSSHPPALPPTVEEAYRRKCIQLKERSKEIEDENDAYRLRLARLKRQIQKCRLERAFLLEQIAKRTSTNVEDSEGSPSPPPTPDSKPLRMKRGHGQSGRKSSLGPDSVNATFISQNLGGLSPSSDAYSHSVLDHVPAEKVRGRGRANGRRVKMPKRPSNAFEIYCNDMRPTLREQNKEKIESGEFRVEEELARGWKELSDEAKEEFKARYEQELASWKEERDALKRSRMRSTTGGGGRGSRAVSRGRSSRFEEIEAEDDQDDDQDVEMAEADDTMPVGVHDADQYETEVEDDNGAGDD
ncbi:hypothetical protein Micbo1qcDRAFT_232115 [Microdochium bolleyi]|uniref:HMG box domain-containing protein n=1 Tax=Microdochium bolleyi TaxID=196109 RepID=A0A136JC39_9PEZI|nr:hypothetical protein Micbo1qcDRAFT_232115 [Microdochium bolleyi]